MLEELFVDGNLKMLKWLIILIMVFGIVEIVNALCFPGSLDNPFCIFGEGEVQEESHNTHSSNIITVSSSRFTFNVSDNFVGINLSINDFPISTKLNYSVRNDDYYPYFKATVPNQFIANLIQELSFTVDYTLNFNYIPEPSSKYNSIPLKNNDYLFKPYFYCEFRNDGILNNTIAMQILSKEQNGNEIKYKVKYNFSDDDIDVDGNINRLKFIDVGTEITCYDPVLKNQPATNWDGVLYWNGTTTLTTYRNWTNVNAFDVGQASGGALSAQPAFGTSDYSRIKDIGIVCFDDRGGDVKIMIINTTSGDTISVTTAETNTGTNTAPTCGITYYNNTDTAIVVYEEGTTNPQFGVRIINGTNVGGEQIIKFDPPEAGSGRTFTMRVFENPKHKNITAVTWKNTGKSVGFVILNRTGDTVFPMFNFSTNSSGDSDENPLIKYLSNTWEYGGQWSVNGSYFFLVTGNASKDTWVFLYNLSNNNISSNFNANTGSNIRVVNVEACALPDRDEQIAVILRGDDGNRRVRSFVLDINGTIESGNPSDDGQAESSGDITGGAISCYTEESAGGDVIFTFVDSNALEIDWFTYNYSNQVWSTSDLTNTFTTGNINSDDIMASQLMACPQGDCFMLTTYDIADDLYSGTSWNGSNFSIVHTTLIDANVLAATNPGNEMKPFAFLFKGNITAVAAEVAVTPPLPPSSTIEIYGQSVLEIYETDKLTIHQS